MKILAQMPYTFSSLPSRPKETVGMLRETLQVFLRPASCHAVHIRWSPFGLGGAFPGHTELL